MNSPDISAQKPESIQGMFDRISSKYDMANTVLSLGTHWLWKKKLVARSDVKPGGQVLDCACGTGDIAQLFKDRVGEQGRVVATDFSDGMLREARKRHQKSAIRFEWADVQKLPYADSEFDCASISFGIRNVADPAQGLREMARVVRPGGRVLVLEFGQPVSKIFRNLYGFYSDRILPTVGGWLSGEREAYRYLQTSSAKFPCGEQFIELARSTGLFSRCSYESLTGGIAFLYVLER